jgi:signal transduction histidine kinase/ActR/RegA family two-component response regulator
MSELVGAVMLVATGFLFSLELRRRRLAEARLHEALVSVEQQVADRTEKLSNAMAERAAALERADAARRAAEEASRLKDQFLATTSHELRTPLNAIVGWVHVLKTGLLEEEQRRKAVDAIDRNARIQTRLIEDLLDVSRMMQGRVTLTMAPIDLRSIVDSAVAILRPAAAAKSIAVDVEGANDALPVIGDEQRLQQIVGNLLANAVKYTAGGGKVTVTTATEESRAIVRVSDNGEGIDASFLPHVFEPFRQSASSTMRTGLGLGLAIVKRLVDLHGGGITVESSGVGQGAVFTVSIPLAEGMAAAAAGASGPKPDFHHLHVLIAEDDADSAAAVTAILKLHGCDTQTARTASDCLRISGEWPTDVLVCDVGLPDDDGYGLLKRLRRRPEGKKIPAIALTAHTRPEDRAKALEAGFRAHLSKPVDPERLLREISSAIQDRSAA